MQLTAASATAGVHATPPVSLDQLLGTLDTSRFGLDSDEAAARLRTYGANRAGDGHDVHWLPLAYRQVASPMVLILLAAAILSLALGERTEAGIVFAIVLASATLGFLQEYRAADAVAKLRSLLKLNADVLRDGVFEAIAMENVVPGDVVRLRTGSLVPADAVLLSAVALHVDESALTGESFPLEKHEADTSVADDNMVLMGSTVRSGEATALVFATGTGTRFGGIIGALSGREAVTSFSAGIARFGLMMTQLMLLLFAVVLVGNFALGRPLLESLLFAAALAVGVTPELLPAIVSVTMAEGARRLTQKGVIVQRLVAIENLGAMNVLCTDKTGTLTEGHLRLVSAVDSAGATSPQVLTLAARNARLQSAMPNPLDLAIIEAAGLDGTMPAKLGEVPYDFERRRLSVAYADGAGATLVTKGAVASILPLCTHRVAHGTHVDMSSDALQAAETQLAGWSAQGYRVIAVATRSVAREACVAADEAGLTLAGYLIFSDPLKEDIAETVRALHRNGISLTLISGDNRHAVAHAAAAAGISSGRVVTGTDIAGMGERRFAALVHRAHAFAEVTPDQKERIVATLRKAGSTVGYLGDGINDAPALRAADIGISVEGATDAARAAADLILLRQDLRVLLEGIVAGRKAFANTVKYVLVTLSANLGNVISMAAASLLLPFLPMLATQVLLNNALSDLPMLAISADEVDQDLVAHPLRWDFPVLLRSILTLGVVSSLFDGITFFVLYGIAHADAATFQTAWFVESLLTELVVVAVLRTSQSPLARPPRGILLWASLGVAVVAVATPYIPGAGLLGFVPLSPAIMAPVLGIVVAYAVATEFAKRALRAGRRRRASSGGASHAMHSHPRR
ncbi:MAG: magnesium-translocating P-type ATPase [Devosia sp.]